MATTAHWHGSHLVQQGCGGQAGAHGCGQQGCAIGAATYDWGITDWAVGTMYCCGETIGA
jgi:hypothetical protein